ANHLREHVVSIRFDATEQFRVDRAHDLRGEKSGRVFTGQCSGCTRKEDTRPGGLMFQQTPHAVGLDPRSGTIDLRLNVRFRAAEALEVLEGEVQSSLTQIDRDVA